MVKTSLWLGCNQSAGWNDQGGWFRRCCEALTSQEPLGIFHLHAYSLVCQMSALESGCLRAVWKYLELIHIPQKPLINGSQCTTSSFPLSLGRVTEAYISLPEFSTQIKLQAPSSNLVDNVPSIVYLSHPVLSPHLIFPGNSSQIHYLLLNFCIRI